MNCPLCGSPGSLLFVSFECSKLGCPNSPGVAVSNEWATFHAKRGNIVAYITPYAPDGDGTWYDKESGGFLYIIQCAPDPADTFNKIVEEYPYPQYTVFHEGLPHNSKQYLWANLKSYMGCYFWPPAYA